MPICLEHSNVLVVGDLMLDEYLLGDTHRISPEAPVPVFLVEDTKQVLGGAGNVVNNLIGLGAKVFVAGLIGNDVAGEIILKQLMGTGANTSAVIRNSSRLSTIKTRVLAQTQQIVRIDREKTNPIDKSDLMLILESIQAYKSKFNSIIISDYAKGVITPELVSYVVENFKDKFIAVDPGGKTIDDYTKYKGVNILTPNIKEASLVSDIDVVDVKTMVHAAQEIFKQTKTESLLITCGEGGMVLFSGNDIIKISSVAMEVFDVSGAGDTVIATLTAAHSCGFSLKESAHIANSAAGVVVGKLGTASITIDDLNNAL